MNSELGTFVGRGAVVVSTPFWLWKHVLGTEYCMNVQEQSQHNIV